MEQTDCSETSVYKVQTPGNYLKESMQLLNACLHTFVIALFPEPVQSGLQQYYILKICEICP
jgi:hypothetical protein